MSTSVGSSKKQESSRKTSISALLTTPKPLCGSQQTLENSSRNGNTRPPYLPLEKSVCRSRSNRTRHGTTDWFKTGKGVSQGCILSQPYLIYMQSTLREKLVWMSCKLESGLPGEMSKPEISRGYHFNGKN